MTSKVLKIGVIKVTRENFAKAVELEKWDFVEKVIRIYENIINSDDIEAASNKALNCRKWSLLTAILDSRFSNDIEKGGLKQVLDNASGGNLNLMLVEENNEEAWKLIEKIIDEHSDKIAPGDLERVLINVSLFGKWRVGEKNNHLKLIKRKLLEKIIDNHSDKVSAMSFRNMLERLVEDGELELAEKILDNHLDKIEKGGLRRVLWLVSNGSNWSFMEKIIYNKDLVEKLNGGDLKPVLEKAAARKQWELVKKIVYGQEFLYKINDGDFKVVLEKGTIKGSEWVSNCFYAITTASQGLKVYERFFNGTLPIGHEHPFNPDGFIAVEPLS